MRKKNKKNIDTDLCDIDIDLRDIVVDMPHEPSDNDLLDIVVDMPREIKLNDNDILLSASDFNVFAMLVIGASQKYQDKYFSQVKKYYNIKNLKYDPPKHPISTYLI